MSYIAAHITTYINVYIYAQFIRCLYIILYTKIPRQFRSKKPEFVAGGLLL